MDNLNPSEISEIIKGRIDSLETSTTESNEGTIVFLSDGIARVHGLSDAMYGELIEFEGGVSGMALNLERDSVGVVIFGDYKQLAEGGVAKCTGKILEVPVGPELVGRVVDALGNPIDGKGPIKSKLTSPVEKVAPGVMTRKPVDEPVQIGLKAVDSMVPIGRGQKRIDYWRPTNGQDSNCLRRNHQSKRNGRYLCVCSRRAKTIFHCGSGEKA